MAKTPRIPTYREQLIEAIREFFPAEWFQRRGSAGHGNDRWTAQRVFWMAILMHLDEAPTLTQRFGHARALLKVLFPRWKLGNAYVGFLMATQRQTPKMLEAIKERLREAMRQWSDHWHLCGWVLFAVDGSRFESPRTAANQAQFGCAGKDKSAPQVFQTTLQHVGTGLPWDFRLGPGTDSERRHLDQMLPGLPEQSLLTADAGFISYDLCCWLVTNGHDFLLRVGSNVWLLTELGFACEVQGQTVYLWPEKRRDQPPIVLRLIVVRSPGKQPVYLVTNVLVPQRLSDETAATLYAARWPVEVYYRTMKQTLGRRTLLSRTPGPALMEQTWAVLGTWLLHLMTAKELATSKRPPRRWSAAKARDAMRMVMRQAHGERCDPRRPSLRTQLRNAIVDDYDRRGPKDARNWPQKKRETPAGPPRMRKAKPKERQRAQEFAGPSLLIL